MSINKEINFKDARRAGMIGAYIKAFNQVELTGKKFCSITVDEITNDCPWK